jgi:hypothetical protein
MEVQLHDGGGRKLLGGSTNVAATCAVVLFGVFAYISYRRASE